MPVVGVSSVAGTVIGIVGRRAGRAFSPSYLGRCNANNKVKNGPLTFLVHWRSLAILHFQKDLIATQREYVCSNRSFMLFECFSCGGALDQSNLDKILFLRKSRDPWTCARKFFDPSQQVAPYKNGDLCVLSPSLSFSPSHSPFLFTLSSPTRLIRILILILIPPSLTVAFSLAASPSFDSA
jgi:hypothetical protein